LQRLTGARSQNICGIRLSEINRNPGVEVWEYTPSHKTEWMGKALMIFLGPQCQEILGPFVDRPDRPSDAYLFDPRETVTQWAAMQRSRRQTPMTPSQAARQPIPTEKRLRTPGERYTAGAYRVVIQRAVRRANRVRERENKEREEKNKERKETGMPPLPLLPPIPMWHPHQLRHHAATLVKAAYGIEASKDYLGHAHVAMTEVYAERDLAKARQIASEIG